MSNVGDDSFMPITTEEQFEKPGFGSKMLTCMKKFCLAIVAAALLTLLVFQLILISAIGEVKAVSDA